jgi:hypothetical protein
MSRHFGRYTLSIWSALAVAGVVAAQGTPQPAELPRIRVELTMPRVTGQSIRVGDGDNLQRALNRARRGDEIVLEAGASFVGNFVLPRKDGSARDGWVIVRSSRLDRLRSGDRVHPADAAHMPSIVSPNTEPAIGTEEQASGWWLAGLEVTVSPDVEKTNYGLIWLGQQGRPQVTLSSVPGDIALDRMYIHGQPSSSVQRCVSLNSARTQITESYITDCHGKGFDTQAIWGGNGPGPYRIANNYLAGAGENIMFGGSDPAIPDLVPSDIEIVRNYIHTPSEWRQRWTKKNLLELKNAARVLIAGNVLDGSWVDGQTGWAILIKSVNQNGKCEWCRSTDVTIRGNQIRNAGAGVSISATGDRRNVDSSARRIVISENAFDGIGMGMFKGDRRGFQVTGGVADVMIERNVVRGDLQAAMLLGATNGGVRRATFRSNVLAYGSYGVIASGHGNGARAINAAAPGSQWSSITFIGPPAKGYPPRTSFIGAESGSPLAAEIRRAVREATAGVEPNGR